MILEVFAVLFIVSVILIVLNSIYDLPSLGIVGYSLLFIVGSSILVTGLSYKTGERSAYTYGNNFTGYHWDYDYSEIPNTKDEIFIFHINKTSTYTEIQGDFILFDISHVIGLLLALLGAFGFIFTFTDMRGGGGLNEN